MNKKSVNSATIRFNNRLNALSKRKDGNTALFVEKLLLRALQDQSVALADDLTRNKKGGAVVPVVPNTVSSTASSGKSTRQAE